ncbi:nicotinate-nucleotide pyrophosphorylase (carboxylating) [Methylohalomonas lacus]|uniref:Probable nicotinate-nucleotide pyrophosphorylase [carboxylating] n=1 Tax=Methylohalomonas lacus TaxID=398773 RepID=A0AAE3HKN2_9GAMM|nr:carboxylating nicotinate-nucleotide diphosphorylase [Methylohalomonas lacus]MCS3902973.1 nicotinate-nucleotide pyrophosphorylase (carboxylating) [Methylohalomonas lacus]
MQWPDPAVVQRDVAAALAEDVGSGDRTAALIPADKPGHARVICREAAVLAGQPWFSEVFRQLDPDVRIDWHLGDGDRMALDSCVCELQGPARVLLTGERSALNFLQLLSGTATVTRNYVDAVAGSTATILDTRKTLPGLRLAQKYAVRCGGGANHRIGLFDAILIKENHIAAAGSISAAVTAARQQQVPIEVEVESLKQLEEATRAGVTRVLLDNFNEQGLRAAVAQNAGRVELEASGSVDEETVATIAATGVDYISIGGLTKHVRAIDFSMRLDG